jgi:hypothetical protein
VLDRLPQALHERVRVLSGRTPVSGRYVLYWMHHALRTRENPALDVARLMAAEQGLPLLVCQGLGGAHRFNNDRHHLFALQCARDVAAELADLGIALRFHLDGKTHGSVTTLAADAAIVVVEQMPVPPFPAWQRSLATGIDAPVLAVDARCIVPMQRAGRRYERAFEFRKAMAADYDARLLSSYPVVDVTLVQAAEDLAAGAFAVINQSDAEFLDAIAACPIDHSVAPVWHTAGGSKAADARWSQFAEHGLGTYHRLRNDAAVAPPQGVSRLSPYLHYGCLSPFRVAREAAAAGGDGAAKFLDELFVWRELAHNLCFYTPRLETLDALPTWARETLSAHADDPRPALHSWDTLAHARTGEPLWDLAQRSLLIHGELHNNLRMTWAKQLLQWTRSPGQALAMLLDLNHRYALDGNDPNSYGGLLWALGLFDRPFKPPLKVLGTVRPRSIAAHQRRLDVAAYAQRIGQPSGAALSVAVIGAGVSGVAAARSLADHGHAVTVFEKGRGVGGRMSTRRTDGGTFDHGAQYFSARSEPFARRVAAWRDDGLVGSWPRALATLDRTGITLRDDDEARHVFCPGMNALCKHLADGLDVRTGVTVERLERDARGWRVAGHDSAGTFDRVIVTAPLPQARALLGRSSLLSTLNDASIRVQPCLAAMLALPASSIAFDAAFVDDDAIAWIANDSSKPGRRVVDGRSHWVVHATEAYSSAHLDAPLAQVGTLLASAFARLCPDLPLPIDVVGHRWRYARVDGAPLDPVGDGALAVGDGVWLAGDACAGASRVESAWRSGIAAAARVMATSAAAK